MATPADANLVTLHRKRRSHGIRLVKGTAVVVIVSCGALAALLWWEDRPLRDIDLALERKDFSQALELVNRYLKESPQQTRALDQKAQALAGLRHWSEANRLFEQTGVVSIASQRAWAESLLHEERWTEALPLLVELNRNLPRDGDLLHELSSCQGHLGFLDEATRAAEQMSKLPEHERRGRLLLGMLHYRRNNNRLAIQAWAPLVEHGPPYDDLQTSAGELLLAYGRALLGDGRPAEAVVQLEQAVEHDASDEACLALAEARDSLGNRKGAVELWTKVAERTPASLEAREGLARAALERRAPAEAFQWLEPFLERDDVRSSTVHLVQRAAAMSGRKEDAARWELRGAELRARETRNSLLDQALRDSPRSFWSRCVRAHRFASAGNRQQALVLTEELLAQQPDEPFVQQLADALRQQKPLPSLDLVPLKQH